MTLKEKFENTPDDELIMIYKHFMVNRFIYIRHIQGYYHPKYEHNEVSIPANRFMGNKLYGHQELKLLEVMWERYINGTFYDKAKWQKEKIFSTKISLPRVEEAVFENHTEKEKEKAIDFIIYKDEKYEYLASGSKRKTYLSFDKSHVIKIPMTPTKLGLEENLLETKTYSENPNSIYAECELIENDWLKMEYVEPVFFTKSDDYPEWILTIAESQVGYNNNGKLVAFDYGSDI